MTTTKTKGSESLTCVWTDPPYKPNMLHFKLKRTYSWMSKTCRKPSVSRGWLYSLPLL